MEPAQLNRRSLIVGAGAVALAACTSDGDIAAPTSSISERDDPPPEATTSDPPQVTTGDQPQVTTGDQPEASAAPDTSVATSEAADDTTVPALTSADFASLAVCAVLPSAAAGPFPTLEQLDRRDVTEGYPGEPLRLGVRVVDTECLPIPGAEVEIWHTDASGDYSSYTDNGSGKDEGEGTTFLRGFQAADADGIAEFLTIYPGWYEGRAVHIHLRVRIGESDALTTQLYFDEEYTAGVYTTGEYAQFGLPDTPWAADGLIGDPTTDGSGITLSRAATATGPGTLGLVNLAVSGG